MAIIHKTRTQLVTEAIRDKILNGEIKAGEPLRQAALAEELKVSRIPVREALLQLEAEGLVNFEAHKGATVSEISAAQVDEIFELRALMESELLKYSIPNLTENHFAVAEEALHRLEQASGEGNELAASGELNTIFHNALYAAADRPQTAEIVSILNKNSSRYVQVHLLLAGGIATAPDEHGKLLELCRNREIEPACEYLKKHILSAKVDLKSLLLKLETESD
ncbi:GntR family transcriptional regulator [Alteromonadaceae bacterium M269]|nr:GntR family transcriptional regulator [Alteromonadaceae bacterium M269]